MSEKYRAVVDMSLRQSADPADPKYNAWFEWPAGAVFEAPPNLNVERALARGIMEPAEKKEQTRDG